jgi:hypothetical protein
MEWASLIGRFDLDGRLWPSHNAEASSGKEVRGEEVEQAGWRGKVGSLRLLIPSPHLGESRKA